MNPRDIADMLASASFRYALRGIAVFPLAAGTKVPVKDSHGLLDATADHDVIRLKWKRHRAANIGAATGSRSGFWVLDVDAHHGGHDSLARLESEHGALPVTAEASTPNGGRHLYWRWNADTEIRNSAGRIGTGLDVRGERGSIVMPPSVLADGRCYAWVRNGATGLADAPAWLVKMALPPPPPPRAKPLPPPKDIKKYVSQAAASELAELARAEVGRRNHALNRATFSLAGFVLAGALPEDWTRSQLETRAVSLGLPAIEARRTIDSAFKAAKPREFPR